MHPEAERLAQAFVGTFWSANHDIRWLELEQEHSLWIDERTVLVGKIDAAGLTSDGEPFFADWKTASKKKARFMAAEKIQWRMSPQALTYGVLNGARCRRFTVRWALKTEPATCDFEWYTYTEAEIEWWKSELLRTAGQIRALRVGPLGSWPTNLTNCTRYGENYRCPFRDEGCWQRDFSHVPREMILRSVAYADGSHLGIEPEIRELHKDNPSVVILDATRVGDWLSCNEYYRRLWEGDNALTETSEALEIGTDFHALIAAHLNIIKAEQSNSQ